MEDGTPKRVGMAETACPYRPEPGFVVIKVLRKQDGAVLGLGEVQADACPVPGPAGRKVLYRGGAEVSEDTLFRILTAHEIVATVTDPSALVEVVAP